MAIKASVARSDQKNSRVAGKEASEKAISQLGTAPNLLLVFSSSLHDQKEMLEGVNETAGGAKIVGCSTAGEITNDGSFVSSVVVMALSSKEVQFITASGSNMDQDAKKAGEEFAKSLEAQSSDISAIIMLPDGLAGNGSDTIRGIQEILSKPFLIGGSAGDDFHSKETFQYFQNQVISKSVVGFGMAGNERVGVGVRHGWSAVGRGRKVTKSKGNILFELDGKPALELFTEYMGEEMSQKLKSNPMIAIQEGATHPLGIQMGEDKYLIRQPFFAGTDGSLICAAEVPEGSMVYIMIGDVESIKESAKQAAQDALDQLGEKPSALLVFSCGARSLILEKRSSEQIQVIKEVVGTNVPIAGFVCYGEQAPIGEEIEKGNKKSFFHNETVVVLALK